MMSPEDIIYLLFNKDLPNIEQSVEFREDLNPEASPSGVEEVLATLLRDGHPMDSPQLHSHIRNARWC